MDSPEISDGPLQPKLRVRLVRNGVFPRFPHSTSTMRQRSRRRRRLLQLRRTRKDQHHQTDSVQAVEVRHCIRKHRERRRQQETEFARRPLTRKRLRQSQVRQRRAFEFWGHKQRQRQPSDSRSRIAIPCRYSETGQPRQAAFRHRSRSHDRVSQASGIVVLPHDR